jgi:hypothetical protein
MEQAKRKGKKMNFKKVNSVSVPEQKNALESLIVNRFDLQLAKTNTLTEQYTILSQRIAVIETTAKETNDLIKTLFGKVSSLEKSLGDTRKNEIAKEVAGSVIPQTATHKKVKGLTINEERFLELREEMTQEDFPDFEHFYSIVKTFCKATNYKVFGKKDMQVKAKELWEKEVSKLDPMTQDLDEPPYKFPEKSVETKAQSQTEIWSSTMQIDKALLDKAVSGVRQCTEDELEIKSVLEFLKADLHNPSIKGFSKWIISLCKTG